MPPPTGVVSGPLMPVRYSLKVSPVSCGSQSPTSSNAFCPARTSFHAIEWPCFLAAASSTSWAAGQMSTPVPSPVMKGMTGSSGTLRVPSAPIVILSAMSGSVSVLRALHEGPQPLVLANAWDAASARLVEELGFPAVATTSGGVAQSLGYG